MTRLRALLALGLLTFALPITCSQSGGGLYTGGVQPSPAGRLNPFEGGIPTDSR